MDKRTRFSGMFLSVAAAYASVAAVQQPVNAQLNPQQAISLLQEMYPGAQARLRDGRAKLIYGVPMTTGETPDAAAAAFLATHSEAFGISEPELVRKWSAGVRGGGTTVIGYSQRIEGYRVEDSLLRVMVRRGSPCRVVAVAGRLAAPPSGGLGQVVVTASGAAVLALGRPGFGGYRLDGQPELVVLPAEGERGDRWAWRVEIVSGDTPRSVFIDGRSGEALRVRDRFANADVTGTVSAYATPTNTLPHRSSNSPVSTPIGYIAVTGESSGGSDSTNANASGVYTLSLPSSFLADIECRLGIASEWGGFRWLIYNANGDSAFPSTSPSALGDVSQTTPPSTVSFLLGDQGEYETAEANGAVQANRCFDHVISRLEIDEELFVDRLRVVVNMGQLPGLARFAIYSGEPQLRFTHQYVTAGGTYWNSCYSSVFPHEFGHYFLYELGLAYAGSFGEGYADTFAVMANNDYVQGRAWITVSGTDYNLREDPRSVGCEYPLTSSSPSDCRCAENGGTDHNAGQVLSGIWVRIVEGMKSQYGTTTGLEAARALHLAWSLSTGGPPDSCNSADPDTLVEVLIADDDDGDLSNGTPHDSIICAAFGEHGIDCP